MTLGEFVDVMRLAGTGYCFDVIQFGDEVDYLRRYEVLDTLLDKENIERRDAKIEQIVIPGGRSDCAVYLEGRFDPNENGFKCFMGQKIILQTGGNA